MKKIILAALAITLTAPLSAQDKMTTVSITTTRQTLIADPDVLWLGETYSIFLLDELNTEKTEDKKYLDSMGIKNNNRIHVVPIKNIDLRKNQPWHIVPSDFDLANTLVDKETIKKGTFYTTYDCSQKFTYEEVVALISRVDTLITYDPETFQEMIQVLVQSLEVSDIKSYKARHLVYYNQRNNTWGTLMEAVAPMLDIYENDGTLIRRTPLFWLKIDNKSTAQDLNNPDISWARRTMRNFSWDEITPIKTIKPVAECMDMMIEKIHKNAAAEDVRDNMGGYAKLTTAEKLELWQTVDTIITYDPNTFQEIVQVVKQHSSGKDVAQFRFIQEWYWDNKRSKMMLSTLFFAPILNRYDGDGNFLFSGASFWKSVK